MAAPSKTPKGVGGRLTAKVGPLPVWAWAAVILGAYLLYTRTHAGGSSAPSSTDATAVTANDGTTGGAQVPVSGGGSSSDNVSSDLLDRLDLNTSALDALTSQILSMPTPYSNFGDGPLAGVPAADFSQGYGPAAQPTVPTFTSDYAAGYGTGDYTPPPATPAPPAAPPPPVKVGAHVAHATQTKPGVLKWGGLTFTTRAAFDKWARSHRTTTAKELRNHPQARAIYSTLR